MKIRNCFVSNSSTASFIVRHKDFLGSVPSKTGELKARLTKLMVKKLEKFGFKKTGAHFPSQYNLSKEGEVDESVYNYGYYVICNEHEVIEFLLENKIPFMADVHYDQFSLSYDGKDTIIQATNFGRLVEMGLSKLEQLEKIEGIQKYTVKRFLKHPY